MSIDTPNFEAETMRAEVQPHFMSSFDLRRQLANCSQSHVRRLVEAGMLPKPVMIGPNKMAWKTTDALQALSELPEKMEVAQAQRTLRRRGRKPLQATESPV